MERNYDWHRALIGDFKPVDFGDLQARGYVSFEEAFAPDDLEAIKVNVHDNDILVLDKETRIRFSYVTFRGDLVRFNIGAEPYPS